MKQARLAWWETLNESMKDLGFERLKSNASIFLYKKKGTTTVVAIVYVDDALFCGPDIKTIKEIKAAFMKCWECRDLHRSCKGVFPYENLTRRQQDHD